MKKIIFTILYIIGTLIISVLAFTIPANPFEIMPTINFVYNMPLWLGIIIVGSSSYLMFLYFIYDYYR